MTRDLACVPFLDSMSFQLAWQRSRGTTWLLTDSPEAHSYSSWVS